MERRCPHCGEPVPSNSINCPACFREIPRDSTTASERKTEVGWKSRGLALLLALIPAVFGGLGIGLIYLGDKKDGAIIFITGILLFFLITLLFLNFGGPPGRAVMMIGLIVMLGLAYLVLFSLQLLMTTTAPMR